MIKSKKQISFSMCVVFIAIIIYLPSVMGYIGVKYPNFVHTYKGTLMYGDLDSFQHYNDDDEIKWVGTKTWYWSLSVSTYFDRVSNPGDGNQIILNYRNSGLTIITVIVYYWYGGTDQYLAIPTGEDFELEYIDIDNDKSVYAISFGCNHFFLRPEIEIDYLGAHYGLM